LFYPQDRRALADLIRQRLGHERTKEEWIAALVPHGNLQGASGSVAGCLYAAVKMPPAVLLIGPDHSGRTRGLSILSCGSWETPLGRIAIDEELAHSLRERVAAGEGEGNFQQEEHALEVQLPFLQRLDVKRFVPVQVGRMGLGDLAQGASALAEVIRKQAPRTLLLVSSNLSSYESGKRGGVRDAWLMDRLCALDLKALEGTFQEKDRSMCGAHAAAFGMIAARELGSTRGKRLAYEAETLSIGRHSVSTGYASIAWW
jgi:hypothetical protein